MNFLYKEIKEICGFFSIQPKEICGFFTTQPKEISFHKNEFSFK